MRRKPSVSLMLSQSEAALLEDSLSFAAESVADIIVQEETFGNRAPILEWLRSYSADTREMLGRIRERIEASAE